MTPTLDETTSKSAFPYGSFSASPTSNVISSPSRSASCLAVSIRAGERSEPVTSAPARAARMATAPVPVPTSSHFSPGCGSSARTRCSCRLAISLATFSNGPEPHITACRCFSSSNGILGLLLFRTRSQLIPRTPQRREEVVVDHLPQHLDGRSLRAHHLVADHPRDDLVVPDAPHRDALVPLGQRLGKLVQFLVVAPPHVQLDDVESRVGNGVLERLPKRRRHAPHLAEAGRVEAAAVS